MEIIRYNLTDSFTLPENFQRNYSNLPFALFDIETTGLNPSYNKVILIGILYYKENKLILEQLFCDSKRDEPYILNEFVQRIKDITLLISYNGDSFDIPFLRKRIEVNKTNKLPTFCSLDLLKFVRSFKTQFNLESCKLKSVERYLGIEREDQISGKESVDLYNRFETTKDINLKELILLHNHDDLRYLLQAMTILDKVSHEKIIGSIPYAFKDSAGIWIVKKANIKGNTLIVSGSLIFDDAKDYLIHRPGYTFEYTHINNEYTLKIPLYKVVLESGKKCFYIDMNEYTFQYTSNLEASNIPSNIIVLKEDKDINSLHIFGFLRELLPNIITSQLVTSLSPWVKVGKLK